MTISLYDLTVPSFLQTLGAVSGLIDKAAVFCEESGHDPVAMADARLAPDMLPLGFQVKSVTMHSSRALEAVRAGAYVPDRTPWPTDLVGLKNALTAAIVELEGTDRAQIDALEGNDMRIDLGERRLDFRAEDFLMSFSLPNFYFHAATAYAILRANGVTVGKLDFLGRLRLKM